MSMPWRCGMGGSWRRPATRTCSRSCARRRSRCRRCRSFVRVPTSATVRSRSPARPISRAPTSSTRCAPCLPPLLRARTSSRPGPTRARSSTTAPASTQGSSLSVVGVAGRAPLGAGRPSRASSLMLNEVAAAAEVEPLPRSSPASTAAASSTFRSAARPVAPVCSAGLPSLDGGPRVVAAMRAQPELLRGPRRCRRAASTGFRRLGRKGWGRGAVFCAASERMFRDCAQGRRRRLPRHPSRPRRVSRRARDRPRGVRRRGDREQPRRGRGRGS